METRDIFISPIWAGKRESFDIMRVWIFLAALVIGANVRNEKFKHNDLYQLIMFIFTGSDGYWQW